MNFDTQDDFLDAAERALDDDNGDRRHSELRFLAELLRGVDARVSAPGLSPSALYRTFVQRGPMVNAARGLLDVIGLPSRRPDDALRPGDWILRAAPGTGDVGHVAVLASAELMTESMVIAEGIAAESARPGSYGLVIEAGARPHRRSRPFARRLLDRRGLVPPHTLLLRPRTPDDPELETREPEPDIEAAPVVPVTYGVGSLVPVRRFVDMPLTYEDMITNTTGSAIIIRRTRCDTLAQVTARGEFMNIGTTGAGDIAAITHADLIRSMSAAPDPKLWSLGPGDTLQAALDLVIYHPADPGDLTHLPAGSARFPLAVIVHGNHGVCSTTLTGALDPPVPALGGGPAIRFAHAANFGAEVPSHMGYSGVAPPAGPLWLNPAAINTGPGTVAYLQEELARHGIISVSVSTNAANYFNLLVETRADLVLKAVAEMVRLDADSGSIFFNRIKPRKVALIGHSRGGDAVVRAARKKPSIGVQALVQIASTDITGLVAGPAPAVATRVDYVTSPMRVAGNVAAFHLAVYGSRDGDVSGLQDVRVSEFGDPFRHYDRSSTQRAFFFWHGATHARFNRFWPDDEESLFDLSDYAHPAGLLTRVDQEARTRELVGGCLRFALNGEMGERDRLNGRVLSAIAPARPIAAMWKLGRKLKTIDVFDDLRTDRNTLGGRNRPPASGLIDEIRLANENPPGAGVTAFQFMHVDRILRAAFTTTPVPGVGRLPGGAPLGPGSLAPTPSTPTSSGRWRADIPTTERNFGTYALLTLRVTKLWDPAAITAANAPVVSVRLTDSAGHVHEERAAGRISTLPPVRRVTLVRPPVSKWPAAAPFPPAGWPATLDLTKFHFETWEVELARFRAAGVNLNQVVAAELEMTGLAGQPVYVDTVSLVQL